MKPWSAVREVLDRAFELEGDDRDAFVASIHDRDPALHEELVRMLAQHAAIEQKPARTAFDLMLSFADELVGDDLRLDHDRVGTDIGPYRLVRLLGTGGVGAVYLAERMSGEFAQHVALKLLRGKLISPVAQASFERERQILAGLHHPGIATLFDGGRTADHEAYYTMEFIDGVGIAEYCDQNALDVGARVALLAQVADALSYAHQNLVIHRDIKPSNVLVTKDGHTKLVDFGLAKALENDALPTLTGFGPMTPAYAAPEQFRNGAITVATDIYQFGVLCFGVLTRSLPYRGDPADRLSWAVAVDSAEPLRLHQAYEPPKDQPNHVNAERRFRKDLTRDLDAIVRKAIAKSPAERYASMDAMVRDLDAFRNGYPVGARKAGTFYFIKRFVQRNRLAVAATLAALLAIVGVSATAAYQRWVASREEARAEREGLARILAQEMLGDFLRLGLASGPWSRQPSALAALDASMKLALATPNGNPQRRALFASVLAKSFLDLGYPERAREVTDHVLPTIDAPDLATETLALVTVAARAEVEAGDVAASTRDLARARSLAKTLALPEDSTPALAIGMVEVRLLEQAHRTDEANARIRALFDTGNRLGLNQSLEFADVLAARAAIAPDLEARGLLAQRHEIISRHYWPESVTALVAERALLTSDLKTTHALDVEAVLARQEDAMRRGFGDASPDLADVLAFRCDYRISVQKYEDALRDCSRVVDILEKSTIPDDAKLAAARQALQRVQTVNASPSKSIKPSH